MMVCSTGKVLLLFKDVSQSCHISCCLFTPLCTYDEHICCPTSIDRLRVLPLESLCKKLHELKSDLLLVQWHRGPPRHLTKALRLSNVLVKNMEHHKVIMAKPEKLIINLLIMYLIMVYQTATK